MEIVEHVGGFSAQLLIGEGSRETLVGVPELRFLSGLRLLLTLLIMGRYCRKLCRLIMGALYHYVRKSKLNLQSVSPLI